MTMRHALRTQRIRHGEAAPARVELVAVEEEDHHPRLPHALGEAHEIVSVAHPALRVVADLAVRGRRGGDHRIGEFRHRSDPGECDPGAGTLPGEDDADIPLGTEIAGSADQGARRGGDRVPVGAPFQAIDVEAGLAQQPHEHRRGRVGLARQVAGVIPDDDTDGPGGAQPFALAVILDQPDLCAHGPAEPREQDRRQQCPSPRHQPPRLRFLSPGSLAWPA